MIDLAAMNHEHTAAIEQAVQWLIDTPRHERHGAAAQAAFRPVDRGSRLRRQRIQFADGARRMSDVQPPNLRYESPTIMQASVYERIDQEPRSIDKKSGK